MTLDVRLLSGSPIPGTNPKAGNAPEVPRSNGQRGRVVGPETAKRHSFAITVNGSNAIGVIVAVDLERGASVSEWGQRDAEGHRLHADIGTDTAGRGG
jgi:hypothetical protein